MLPRPRTRGELEQEGAEPAALDEVLVGGTECLEGVGAGAPPGDAGQLAVGLNAGDEMVRCASGQVLLVSRRDVVGTGIDFYDRKVLSV